MSLSPSRYQVYVDGKPHSEHVGLMAACATARTEAHARPGQRFRIAHDGVEMARYHVAGGKLVAWMR